MKVSLKWLKEYFSIDKEPKEIAEILTSIGLEVEGWEQIDSVKGGLRGVVTAKVVECGRHPNADKLSLTKVDVGDGNLLSVVCGAPNVAAGQIVVLAQVGATLYSGGGDDALTIKESKIRGELSQGMLCAEDELGLGASHAGILVLPENTPIGKPASEVFEVNSDTIIEIGLTPNRGDATHHMGVARDLAAYFRFHDQRQVTLHVPEKLDFSTLKGKSPISVSVENTEACTRYFGLSLSNVQVKDSPNWLKNRLLSLGQRPINNVVDITNLVRLEMGQPLHAFDRAFIKGNGVRIKTLPIGTKFKALDASEITLTDKDLVICDAENNPLCIAGVFGGFESGVDENTNSVFLEAAIFHPSWVRNTMVRHNQRTDAAWTFEKGVDANRTLWALERAAALMVSLAGAKIDGNVGAFLGEKIEKAQIPMKYAVVNRLTGVRFSKSQVAAILAALEIGIENETNTGFTAIIPTDKSEVTRQEDVIEEILRIYGFDNVPLPAQIRSSMEVSEGKNEDAILNKIADLLSAQGLNECQALSLSSSSYFETLFPMPKENLVFVHNTANQGLDIMRPSMLFSSLEAVRHNLNRQQSALRLFEFGKTYERNEDKFKETRRLSITLVGEAVLEGWRSGQKRPDVDFYNLKTVVEQVLSALGITTYQESSLEGLPFAFGTRYGRGQQILVQFGQVSSKISKAMDIKKPVFYADFDWTAILKALPKKRIEYTEISKYPTVRRDLALVLDKAVQFSEVKNIAFKTEKKLLKAINLFDIYENENQLGADKKSYAVSFLFESVDSTLKDKDIDSIMKKLSHAYETRLGASIRS